MTDHHIHPNLKAVSPSKKALRAWGHYAFARHCFNLGIPFEDCYWMIFGSYPKTHSTTGEE